jgi:hypothetical protein
VAEDKAADKSKVGSVHLIYSTTPTTAVAFDFANDLAARNRSNLDHNRDSNMPNRGYSEGHTNHNSTAVVS